MKQWKNFETDDIYIKEELRATLHAVYDFASISIVNPQIVCYNQNIIMINQAERESNYGQSQNDRHVGR